MPRFKDYVKKLPRHFQQVILDAVEDVLANPDVGKIKKATWRALGFISLLWSAN